VHPLRWPGSWHRKDIAKPRLARIVSESENEVGLYDALERLPAAMIDFGQYAGAGMERVGAAELELPTRPADHWEALARGVDKGTTGRINAIISIFGYLLKKGVEPHLAMALVRQYNIGLCRPPLADKKIDDAFRDIIRRERDHAR
jgi:hypothetical protein